MGRGSPYLATMAVDTCEEHKKDHKASPKCHVLHYHGTQGGLTIASVSSSSSPRYVPMPRLLKCSQGDPRILWPVKHAQRSAPTMSWHAEQPTCCMHKEDLHLRCGTTPCLGPCGSGALQPRMRRGTLWRRAACPPAWHAPPMAAADRSSSCRMARRSRTAIFLKYLWLPGIGMHAL